MKVWRRVMWCALVAAAAAAVWLLSLEHAVRGPADADAPAPVAVRAGAGPQEPPDARPPDGPGVPQPQYEFSHAVERAIAEGAKARVTLRVANSTGRPVLGAKVWMHFERGCEPLKNCAEGLTDTNGLFAAERVSRADCNWRIEKEGYYRTEGRHSFMDNLSNASVKNGRWQPWNPIVQVRLKEHRSPIPLYTKTLIFDVQRGSTVGFDCLKGSLVQPNGTGNIADLFFHFESESDKVCYFVTNSLACFVGNDDGIQILKRDETSGLRSEYEAPENGYSTGINFCLRRMDTKIFEEIALKENEYIAFKTARQGHDGNTQSMDRPFFYGKIYTLKYSENIDKPGFGAVRLSYYFNPTPNDRNLEFDGKTNLFRPSWHDYDWPREP